MNPLQRTLIEKTGNSTRPAIHRVVWRATDQRRDHLGR